MHLLFFLLGFGSAWELTLLHVNDIHVSKSFLMRIFFVHRSLCGVQLYTHTCVAGEDGGDKQVLGQL